MEPRLLVYSDVDGCIIGPDYSPGPAKSVIEKTYLLRVPLVPVSSKTVYELLYYLTSYRLGATPWGVILVAEEGAAIYASPGLLEEATRYEEAIGLEVLELSPRLEDYEDIIVEALRQCRDRVVRFTEADPLLVAELTGLGFGEANAATLRVYTEVVWSPSRECLLEVRRRAEELGLSTYMGKRFLHLAAHRGKSYALRVLLEKVPVLRSVKLVVALGDTELDREMIEEAGIGVVVPSPQGLLVHPRSADYRVAPEPGPPGWTRVVEELLLAEL